MKSLILVLLIVLIILISAGLYWFGYRPEQIRKECYIYAKAKSEKQMEKFFGSDAYNMALGIGGDAMLGETLDPIYNSCLREKGIKE